MKAGSLRKDCFWAFLVPWVEPVVEGDRVVEGDFVFEGGADGRMISSPGGPPPPPPPPPPPIGELSSGADPLDWGGCEPRRLSNVVGIGAKRRSDLR